MARRRKPAEPKTARSRRSAGAKTVERPRSAIGRAREQPFEAALAAVGRLIDALERPSVVIGGVAVIAHGFARATADIDLAVVAAPEEAAELLRIAEAAGFKFWKQIVWDKVQIGMGYHYRARYECILFFEKGKRKLNDLGVADIITCPRIRGGYPAEKPPQVTEVLLKQSTQPGELVIDPFMGSGSVGVAAVGLGRNFMGNDLCAEAIDITRRRLIEAGAKEPLHELPAPDAHSQLGLSM